MAGEEDRPGVFLSYTRRQPDEGWAARMVDVLKTHYQINVWFDKRGIRIGHDFREEIEAAIRAADALVFLGSSASVASDECQKECVYARNHGKPIIPLFIENVSWGDFPKEFHSLQYQQLHRANDQDDIAAMIGQALLDAGLAIDPAQVPQRQGSFDLWADNIHPSYCVVRQADPETLRSLVDECGRKLGLSPKHGFHNLNLALLFLRLGEHRRASQYAETALGDLPGRADSHYYAALIAAASEPLSTTPKRRIDRILQSLESSVRLGHEATIANKRVQSGLPWLLRAAIAFDYYGRNFLISRVGDPSSLISEARQRYCEPDEVDRLLDCLLGLSEWSTLQITASKSVSDLPGTQSST